MEADEEDRQEVDDDCPGSVARRRGWRRNAGEWSGSSPKHPVDQCEHRRRWRLAHSTRTGDSDACGAWPCCGRRCLPGPGAALWRRDPASARSSCASTHRSPTEWWGGIGNGRQATLTTAPLAASVGAPWLRAARWRHLCGTCGKGLSATGWADSGATHNNQVVVVRRPAVRLAGRFPS